MSYFDDYIAGGLFCQVCGTEIDGKEPGFPRTCEDCLADEKPKKKYKRGEKRMEKKEFVEKETLAFKNQMDPECEEERILKPNIVGVKYKDKFDENKFSGKEYCYFADMELKVGDVVEVATKYGSGIAKVTRINVDEKEIENIKNYMKKVVAKIEKKESVDDGNTGK